jgi:CheY-like chemotaxis protein
MLTCVLIDDDIDDHEIFDYVLKEINPTIRCYFFSDGDEAIYFLTNQQSAHLDCIFIDMNMPRMSGGACLKQIKSLKFLNHVPIAMYTTSSDPKDKMEAMRLGAQDYIIKQSSLRDLKPRLERFINQFVYQLG